MRGAGRSPDASGPRRRLRPALGQALKRGGSFAHRQGVAEAGEDGLEVLPGVFLLAAVAQQIGGVEGEHDGDAFECAPLSAGLADGEGFGDEAADGGGAKADDQLGLDDGDLPLEIGQAAGHLVGRGDAVAGGAALDDVADEDLLAGVAHGGDHLGEELSGAADEGEALFVFIGAGAFADEHDVGVDGALSGHGVLAGGGEGAGVAGGDFGRDGCKAGGGEMGRG